MKTILIKNHWFYFTIALVIVALDQISKYWAEQYLVLYKPLQILPFLNFTLSYNTGAAFSIFADWGGVQRWFLTAISLIASIFICWALPKRRYHINKVVLAFILGGAVGNLIDRALEGRVVDFISVYYREHYFAIFNIADSAISIGAMLLLYQWLMVERKLPEEDRDW